MNNQDGYTGGKWINRMGLIMADQGTHCDRIADMDKDNTNIEADARLIASAPCLLGSVFLSQREGPFFAETE